MLSKNFFSAVTLSLLTILIAGMSALVGCNDVPEIDIDSASGQKAVQKADGDYQVEKLKVAVAAMISPKETRKYYDDILQLIGARLGLQVELIQKKTYAEVNDLMEAGGIDMAFVCSGPYVRGKERFGMELLVVPVVNSRTVYFAYLIAHKNSGIDSLDGFKGKIFAFTDSMSNTGYLVPKYMIESEGHSIETFFKETFFTHGHDNSIKMVAEHIADGAAVDSLIWDYLEANGSEYTGNTKIVVKSPPYGIPPVVVHPDLPDDRKMELQKAFLTLHEDKEGAKILEKLKIQKFVKGNDSDYNSIREIDRWIAMKAAE